MNHREFNFLSLVEQYNEPHRHYHNFSHIARMYEWVKEYKIKLSDEQNLAILFHDIYYEADKSKLMCGDIYISNEERSAELSRNWCEYNHYGKEFAEKVYQIIRDTEHHIPNIEESKNVLDLDLLGLAFTEVYFSMGKKIRKEYDIFSDEEFNKGQIEWIKLMLEKERIFHGYFAEGDYEIRARVNLEKDLKERGGKL